MGFDDDLSGLIRKRLVMIRLIIFSLIFFVASIVSGQTLNGVIVDEYDEPVIGAHIKHVETDFHTHSDELGRFFIRLVQKGDSLQFSHIGYDKLDFVVENLDNIEIELKEAIFELGEIVVGQNIKKVNIISTLDFNVKPFKSSQEVLRILPGLFIGQHAGGGKAEQIFLRGFDIDHGTDVQISVDGMPVNMVSHAHGQGYADLHFLIPETVALVDFGKGPYFADKGNFATAGYAQFKTKDKLKKSLFSLEAGRFNNYRALGMLKLLNTEKHNIYMASEYMISDGPFESSQNFIRNNLMLKYSGELENGSRLSAVASHFTSKWDASGQIPQRLVDDGTITRFGAVDDTEGGQTSRTNFALDYSQPVNDNTFVKTNFYYVKYDFELFSNFTFFLDDPVNGDQIRQKEDREIFGFQTTWNHSSFLKNTGAFLKLGVGLRSDEIKDNELSSTLNRKTTLSRRQFGDVDEKNIFAFADLELDFGDLLIQPAVRFDMFKFNYVNNLDTLYDNRSTSKGTVSPKLNFIYNASNNLQVFLKTGVGFHSNDTRVIIEQQTASIIPAAYGADLGAIYKPVPRLITNIALWYLGLDQEFVYVGDAGIVEPSGKTKRMGVDLGFRYQISSKLFANADFNYAHARSTEEPEGQDYIPLAPSLTSTAGLSYSYKKINAGIDARYLMDRPANEDNSIIAEGYLITDLNASYQIKNINIGIIVENLFNQEWKETQFATETRLFNEVNPVEEIHFTPGTPIFIKGLLKYNF